MAADTYVASTNGEKLVVAIGATTAGPFTAPMTINMQRSLELSATAEASVIPDTTNPSAPGKTSRTVTATDWKVSGQGMLNVGDDITWADWLLSGAPMAVQVSNALTGGLVLVGMAVLTSFSMTSDGIGKKVQGSVTIEGADLPAATAHA